MNKLYLLVLISILLTSFSSCFPFGGQKIKISIVDSGDNTLIEEISCIISSSSGSSYFLESNPGIITAKQDDGALIINCKKPGYKELNTFITGGTSSEPSKLSIGGSDGLLVSTGSSSSTGYKSNYVFSMEKVNNS